MSKTTMTAVLAAMLALSMPVYAQTTSSPSTAPSARGAATHTLQPGQIRGSEMIGSSVYDTQNRDIGKIKDVILDHQGKVDMVVLDVGAFLGMGGKYVAVPMRDLKTASENGKVRWKTDMTKERLQQARAFDLGTTTSAGTLCSSGTLFRNSATFVASPRSGPAKVRKLMDSPPRRAAKACINEKRRCSAGTERRIAIVRSTCRAPRKISFWRHSIHW